MDIMYFDISMIYPAITSSCKFWKCGLSLAAASKLLKVGWSTVLCCESTVHCIMWEKCSLCSVAVLCCVSTVHCNIFSIMWQVHCAVLQGEASKEGNALLASFRQLSCQPILSGLSFFSFQQLLWKFSVFSNFLKSFQFLAIFLQARHLLRSALFSVFSTISCSILHPN